jgi:hypothetical protein
MATPGATGQHSKAGARPLATPGVVEAIEATLDVQAGQWSAMFGDAAVKPTVLPEPMAGDVIELEGAELRVLEVGQGDIRPSTVLHLPGIATVVAGDVIYNQDAFLADHTRRSGTPGRSSSRPARGSPATALEARCVPCMVGRDALQAVDRRAGGSAITRTPESAVIPSCLSEPCAPRRS